MLKISLNILNKMSNLPSADAHLGFFFSSQVMTINIIYGL